MSITPPGNRSSKNASQKLRPTRRLEGTLRDVNRELGRGYVHVDPASLGRRARQAIAPIASDALAAVRVDMFDLPEHRMDEGMRISFRIQADGRLLLAKDPRPAT